MYAILRMIPSQKAVDEILRNIFTCGDVFIANDNDLSARDNPHAIQERIKNATSSASALEPSGTLLWAPNFYLIS
jgi:hypothetical protein